MTGFFVPQKESTSWQSASSMPHSCAAWNVLLPVTESRSSGLGVFIVAFCRSEHWNSKLTAVSGREVSRKQIMSALKYTSQRCMSPSRHGLPSSAMFQHHRTSTRVPTFSPTFWVAALIWQVTWILFLANMFLPLFCHHMNVQLYRVSFYLRYLLVNWTYILSSSFYQSFYCFRYVQT